ncbi:YDG domain-containing protein [Aurantiacibacter xanthus]|nr:YDG domain-containing protein [Aurantiacibacter xanthus]
MSNNRTRKKIALHAGASLSALVTVLVAPAALANPQNGQVIRGEASIFGEGTKAVTIDQHSDRAVINWDDFSIGSDEAVTFLQPGARSVAVNRITGQNPSQLMGSLTANGQVVLINRNGIAFGQNARVDAAGLVASTADIDDDAFMAGGNTLRFDSAEPTMADIVVNGSISVKDAGLAAFVAPHVRNDGVIMARMGRVALGAGTGFSLDLYGDGLIKFAPGDEISADIAGDSVQALVENSGQIIAEGGRVLLTAAAARDVVRNSVNVSGLVSAASATRDGGTILLTGPGRIETSGEGLLDVSSDAARGGTVKLLGETVALLDKARIDATGLTGGGEVLMGGNYLGQGPESNADFNLMAPDAIINASATGNGKGGRVILWSNKYTNAWGTILATGGNAGGDGGFVETSSKDVLNMVGTVDAGAPAGAAGTWLLDPGDVTIVNGSTSGTQFYSYTSNYEPSTDSAIPVVNIEYSLNRNNVTIKTGSGDYDINVKYPISWNSSYSLTLIAGRHIITYESISNSGNGGIYLYAAQNAIGTILIRSNISTYGGDINMRAGNDLYGSTTGYRANVIVNADNTSNGVYSRGGDIIIANSSVGAGPEQDPSWVRGTDIRGTVDAGTGDIAIYGYYGYVQSPRSYDVALPIENATIKGRNITIYGKSRAYGTEVNEGVRFYRNVNISASGYLNITGISNNGIGISTWRDGTTNLILYAAGDITLNGITSASSMQAIDLTRYYGSVGQVRIGYDGSNVSAGRITIEGTAPSGLLDLRSQVDIRTTGRYVTISDNGSYLSGIYLSPNTINPSYGYTKITLGGTQTGAITMTGAASWSASDSINWIERGGFYVNSRLTNTASGGDINVFGATGASGDSILNDRLYAQYGSINIYSGFNTAGSSYSGYTGKVSFSGYQQQARDDIIVRARGGIAINSGATFYTSTGDIRLSTENSGSFYYNASSSALSAAGRWIVYSTSPNNTTFGNLVSGNDAVWNQSTYSTLISELSSKSITGKRFAFSTLPDSSGGYYVETFDAPDKTYGTSLPSSTSSSTYKIYGSSLGTNPGANSAYVLADMPGVFTVTTNSPGYATKANVGTHVISGTGPSTFNGQSVTYRNYGRVAVVPRAVTLTGSQVYDGTRTVRGQSLSVTNLVSGDTVTVSGSAGNAVSSKNIGTRSLSSLSGLSLSNSNYTLSGGSGSITITRATITASLAGTVEKVYNANRNATLAAGNYSLSGIANGDIVSLNNPSSGTYNTKDVGSDKAVSVSGLSISGTDAGNYQLASSSITGNVGTITQATLTASLTDAVTRTYDATTDATLAAKNYDLAGIVSGDTVTLNNPTTGTYDTKNVGTGKTISVTGLAISGADAGNYQLAADTITGTIGEITKATLTASLTGAVTRTYDASTDAALAAGNYSVSGILSDDIVTLNNPTAGSFDTKNVGTGKTITVSGLTLADTDAGNYQLAATSITGDIGAITQAQLAVTNVTAANKVYDATLTASLSGGTVAALGTDLVSLVTTGATGAFASKDVGTGKAVTATGYTLTGTDADNYAIVQPIGLTADITRASLAVTDVIVANKIYDTTRNATLSGGAVAALGTDAITLVNTEAVGLFDTKNVGTDKTVTATGYTLTGTDAGNYTIVQPTGLTASITPAQLAVTDVTAANKVYDATLTATLSGGTVTALGTDTVSLVTTGATGAFATKDVGTGKAVTATGYTLTGTDAANYALVQPTGLSADITRALLAVTGVTAANRTYDATRTATLNGGAVSALGTDLVTLVSAGATGLFDTRNVGTDKTVTATGYTLTGTDADNYTIVQPTGLTASIAQAQLAVTGVTAASKVYDATLTATLSGGTVAALGTDTVSLVTTGATGAFATKDVGTGKAVTATGYTLTGTDAANYAIIQPTGLVADITRAQLTVTGVEVASRVYDTTRNATLSGGKVTGFDADDVALVIDNASALFNSKDVGVDKAVTAIDYALSGADAGNYTIVQPIGLTASITPAQLAVTGVTAANKVYDTTRSATLSGGSISALGTDVVTLVTTGAAGLFDTRLAGANKSVVATGYTLTGNDAHNYAIVQPTGLTANITRAQLTVTGVTAANKVYDATRSATLSGGEVTALGSDTVSLVRSDAAGLFNSRHVGIGKAITVTGYALTGADAANYTVVQPTSLTASITPAPINVTGVTVASRVYDTTRNATLSGGAVAGFDADDVSLVIDNASALFATKDVGSDKAVTATGYTLAGVDAGNYSIVLPTDLTASITQAQLAVTGVNAANKVYDTTRNATLSGGSVSALGTDLVTLVSSGAVGLFDSRTVGTNKAVTATGYTLSGNDAHNYAIVQPTGLSANITRAQLTVTGITAADKVYDASRTAALSGGTVTALGTDLVTLVSSGAAGLFDTRHAGANKAVAVTGYTLTGADAGNYAIVQPTGLTASITPAQLSVTGVSVASRAYNATRNAALSGGTVAALGADTVTLVTTDAVGEFDTRHVGTDKAVAATGYALTGADAGNYTIVQPTGLTASISQATITASLTGTASKVYDANRGAALAAGNYGLSGVFAGDTVTLNNPAAATYDSKDVGTGKTVSVTGLALGGTHGGNYVLASNSISGNIGTITRAQLAVTSVTAANKVYDATRTATLSGGTVTAFGTDSVSLVTTGAAGLFDSRHAGANKVVAATGYSLTGADAGNYTIVQPTGLTASITPAQLLVTGVTAANKVYDATRSATLSGGTVTQLGTDAVTLVSTGAAGLFDSRHVGNGKTVTATGYTLTGADAGNYTIVQPTGLTASISQATITASLTGTASKVYDANRGAALAAGNYSLSGVFAGDTVALNNPAEGTYDSKDVGTGKTISVSGLAIAGTDAGNYVLASGSITGNIGTITRASLAVTDVVVASKVYDATRSAALSGGSVAALGTDNVTLVSTGAAGLFDTRHVGTNKTVTATGYTLTGADAGNYTIVQPTGLTASISQATITASLTGTAAKVYDASRNATLAAANYGLSGVFAGDTVTLNNPAAGVFDTKNVGTGKTVSVSGLSISGTDSGNYVLASANITGAIGTITPAQLVVTGISAFDKVYDATRTAQLGGGTVTGLGSDDVALVATDAEGLFDTRNVGSDKLVTATGYTLAGGDAGNYAIVQPSPVTASITPATLTVAGSFTARDKVYDATTAVAIDTTGLTLSGVLASDNVELDIVDATGSFADKNVGTDKTVSLSIEGSLAGADAGNYVIAAGAPTGLADITPFALDVVLAGIGKVYDGNTDANAVVEGDNRFAGDDLRFAVTASYADKNVGTNKAVTVSEIALTGADAANYTVGSRGGSASSDITRLDSVAWTGAGDGVNWFDPANWAGRAIPDLANVANVILPAGVMVTFDTAAAISDAETDPVALDTLIGTLDTDTVFSATDSGLTLVSGELAIGEQLSLDRLEQTGGTIGGEGTLTVQDSAPRTDLPTEVEQTTTFLQVANVVKGILQPMNRDVRPDEIRALSEIDQPWLRVQVDEDEEEAE